MAWLAVDQDESEFIYSNKPIRKYDLMWEPNCCNYVHLPKGTIKKIFGIELTWNNEPVELKLKTPTS